MGVQGKSARWRWNRNRDAKVRALFHDDFGDPEQIQGRFPPVLSFPFPPSMNMDAAGPRAQGKTMGSEYI